MLLALAAWGTVRLLDALLGRPRGAGHVVAGLLVLLNPYVVVFTRAHDGDAARLRRAAVAAAVPSTAACGRRGRGGGRPRSRCVVACTGGGVNAAVTAWLLLGPLLLALYERWCGERGVRGVLALRVADGAADRGSASLWWVVPVLVQARHGVDFLRFTEQPGTIWSTTSLSESLRLMGYWLSYLGVGYGGELRPLFSGGGAMLFFVAGRARRAAGARARPQRLRLDAALALRAVLPAAGARGPGRDDRRLPGGHAAAAGARTSRTTTSRRCSSCARRYKAGPLLALGIACLAGRSRRRGSRSRGRWPAWRRSRASSPRWPLATGRALDSQLLLRRRAGRVGGRRPTTSTHGGRRPPRPRAARPALRVLRLGRDGRRRSCPRWPSAPVAVRYAVPYADLRVGRPAVDDRRARAAAAGAARPARAAAGPGERRDGGGGRRRRPHAQRRRPGADGGRRARPARRSPTRALGAGAARAARGGHARRRGGRCRACAPGTGRRRGRWCAWSAESGATVVDGGAEGIAGAGRVRRAAATGSPTRATSTAARAARARARS